MVYHHSDKSPDQPVDKEDDPRRRATRHHHHQLRLAHLYVRANSSPPYSAGIRLFLERMLRSFRISARWRRIRANANRAKADETGVARRLRRL